MSRVDVAPSQSRSDDRWFTVTYRVACSASQIEQRARAIATEQSVEMPVEAIRDPHIAESIVGRVETIAADGADQFRVKIKLAVETTGLEAGQLLNMAFGNTSLQPDVELVNIDMPATLVAAFGGPGFGIEGIRERTRAWRRPLTCTALKPQGLAPDALGTLAATFARAGIDVIKDDHGIADQAYAPFAARVAAVQRAVRHANRETGGSTVYAPTLSGPPSALARQARIAHDEGVAMVLVAPMISGMPAFRELVREHLRVPVLAHPAFAGALRVAPSLLLGKLFRLFGADAVIFPNYGGRFSYSADTCRKVVNCLRADIAGVRPALAVPAGGMSVERVAEMRDVYGDDTMLLIGGALLAQGDELPAACRAFVAKVHA